MRKRVTIKKNSLIKTIQGEKNLINMNINAKIHANKNCVFVKKSNILFYMEAGQTK